MHGEAVYRRGENIFEDLKRNDNRCSSTKTKRCLDALSLDEDCTHDSPCLNDLSPCEQRYMLKRTRSLDSGRSAKAVAVKLAFKNNLYLV
jgi:hypothetical protein